MKNWNIDYLQNIHLCKLLARENARRVATRATRHGGYFAAKLQVLMQVSFLNPHTRGVDEYGDDYNDDLLHLDM